MKKSILLISFIFCFNALFAQIKPIDYGVTKNPSIEETIRTAAAMKQANAAKNAALTEAMKSNYEIINIDELLGKSSQFKYVILNKITGWMTSNNRSNIFKELTASGKYTIINPERPERNYKIIPDSILNSPKTIFLEWYREAPNDNDRITHLVLKNIDNKIIFDANYKNKSTSEMLKPLMGNYNFTKELAVKKIKEYKELKDLGVISQEEFDSKISPLKKILLEN